MMAIESTGGGVGIVAFSSYLRPSLPGQGQAFSVIMAEYGTANVSEITAAFSPEKVEKFKADYAAYEKAFPPATVSDYADSIDYTVNLLGIDHVFISSDMEHGGGVTGWKDAGEAFGVTEELALRGYSEEQITKLWWGNFARIWRAVDAAAEL